MPRLTVVGSVNVDLTARVTRLPAPGETVAATRVHRGIGGKGVNQAVAAARLGARVRFVGAVGDDPDGDWLSRRLSELRIEEVELHASSTTSSGLAMIQVDEQGENVIIVHPGANAEVPAVDAAGGEEWVLTQLEVPLAVTETIALRRPAFLAVNASPATRLPQSLIGAVDLFVVNETEYGLMPELDLAALVAVTYGAGGAALLSRGREIARAPGLPASVISTVGAGDAFCAALVVGLARRHPPEVALQLACAVGAEAVAHPNTQPPLQMLDRYLSAVV